MVAGHLREKDGYYHIVLCYTDEFGVYRKPSKSTGLKVKGNKKKAEAMLLEARRRITDELEKKKNELEREKSLISNSSEILFVDYMTNWLMTIKNSIEVSTFVSYEMSINKRVIPYFSNAFPYLKLSELTVEHLERYYNYELNTLKVSANTIKHRHANIHKALNAAVKKRMIAYNPASLVELPKKETFKGQFYNSKELDELFKVIKGDPAEFGIIVGAFYGLRRSEIIGLKWSSVDFENKTFTIDHTVVQLTVDGKTTLVEKNRAKNKSSRRTLPLVKPFEDLLIRMKKEQEENRRLCGNSYCKDYLDYIYVNEIGERIKPNYLTQHFPIILEKNNLKKIRFHDLRHSCASLLISNGVPIKQVSEWLGHSDISTTANIYVHLTMDSKIESANAILGFYPTI